MHRIRLTLAVGVALLVAGGLTLTGAGAAGAAGPEKTGAPTVGTCYRLTQQQLEAISVPAASLDCRKRHTAQVYDVALLPSRLTWESPAADLDAAMSSHCWSAFRTTFGSSALRYARSQYGVAFYGPTASQQRAGARWYDCLAVVFDAHGLADLPRRLPHLSATLPDSVATCATRTLVNTVCAQRHTWRVTHAFYARGSYTEKNVDKAAARTCPDHVTSARWLRSSMDVPGKRFVVTCYSRTRR